MKSEYGEVHARWRECGGVQVGRREVKSISAGMELADERGSEYQCKVDVATILYYGAWPDCIEERGTY